MTVFLVTLVAVGFCVVLLGFNIFFRRKPFPDGEISHNEALREKGIICAKEEELRLWSTDKGGGAHTNCSDCSFFASCERPGKGLAADK